MNGFVAVALGVSVIGGLVLSGVSLYGSVVLLQWWYE